MALIELAKVEKVYPLGNQQVTALAGFTLSINKGEFTVLAGPSGSGKTTVLNLIGGIDQPTAGTIIIEGRDVGNRSTRALADFRLHHIGFIFQSYNLIPVLTAAENAEFTLMLQGVAKPERQTRIRELFADLGIAGLENRKPRDLSGGQQQRVAVARAIASHPAVVLADEPTANLDSQTAEELLDLMLRLNTRYRTTFIFSSHDPLVISRARRIIRLRDGRLEDDREQPA
ncbi:MAG: ABC transporter ATP-binding protein [Pedobacter sp.]